ncbi:MAG: hypothetical protein BZ136_08425, partial [Methanosphaera sp. rholeuAM74]
MCRKIAALMSVIITLVYLLPCVIAFAYADEANELIWKTEEIKNSGDHYAVIDNCRRIIKYMENEPLTDTVNEVISSRYQAMALAYEALGDYKSSAKAYNEMIPYLESNTSKNMYDLIKEAKEKVLQYTPEVKAYVDQGDITYFGAKNEPQNGVLFGLCSDGKSVNKIKNDSAKLVYCEIGDTDLSYEEYVINAASNSGQAVEFALNCPNHEYDIKNIYSYEGCLSAISDMISKYSNVPVYLRFAAEFNVWPQPPTANEFISAFRYVSDIFHKYNDNVAVVWSPNQISNWNLTLDNYYPGDKYVDWVGLSLYAVIYALNDSNNSNDYMDVMYRAGKAADPVKAIRGIVSKYGYKKPIMISESGCGHTFINGSTKTDFSDWAVERLTEYYTYLPMVYPQVKFMAYFDKYMNEAYDFQLSAGRNMEKTFNKLTESDRFIHKKAGRSAPIVYSEIKNNTVLNNKSSLSAYTHIYSRGTHHVSYYIDNSLVGTSYELPYSVKLNTRHFSEGAHELKVEAVDMVGDTYTIKSSVQLSHEDKPKPNISEEVENKRMED